MHNLGDYLWMSLAVLCVLIFIATVILAINIWFWLGKKRDQESLNFFGDQTKPEKKTKENTLKLYSYPGEKDKVCLECFAGEHETHQNFERKGNYRSFHGPCLTKECRCHLNRGGGGANVSFTEITDPEVIAKFRERVNRLRKNKDG